MGRAGGPNALDLGRSRPQGSTVARSADSHSRPRWPGDVSLTLRSGYHRRSYIGTARRGATASTALGAGRPRPSGTRRPAPARDGTSMRSACRALAGCRHRNALALTVPPRRRELDRPAGRWSRRARTRRLADGPRWPAPRRPRPHGRRSWPSTRLWGGGVARRRPTPPMSAVATNSSADFRASGWTELGEPNPKPLSDLYTPETFSCASHIPAVPSVAHESAWQPPAHTAMGQLTIERNWVSRGPPDTRSVA